MEFSTTLQRGVLSNSSYGCFILTSVEGLLSTVAHAIGAHACQQALIVGELEVARGVRDGLDDERLLLLDLLAQGAAHDIVATDR